MVARILISLVFVTSVDSNFFVNVFTEEGGYQSAYPLVSLAVYVRDHACVLPYLFGFLENLNYPKDRTSIDIFMDEGIDSTPVKVKWWLREVASFYRSVQDTVATGNWRESALRNARLSGSDYLLYFTGDYFFFNPKLLQNLMALKKLVVLPHLHDINDNANGLDDSLHLHSRNGSLPMFIQLNHSDASYVTFAAENIYKYDRDKTPDMVFATSLSRIGALVHVDSENSYGYDLGLSRLSMDMKRKMVNEFVSSRIAKFGLDSVDVSSVVKPQYPKASSFGMDRIYVINLKRRAERRAKMEKILKLLGFDYSFWSATDGSNLDDERLFKEVLFLPGYEDPYFRRPMKAGEVGCFLSHYRIWQDVLVKQYKRVIIFEDDLNFRLNSTIRLIELLEDLDASNFSWDLIYLGRKQLSNAEERWVKGIRHLSTVGYSYWTIGYMLSQSGARKLLDAMPLKKLIPVDEYIPIMFDRHPNTTWKAAFSDRNLLAFTVYPSIVYPEKFTADEGYVSDTESSPVIFESVISNPAISYPVLENSRVNDFSKSMLILQDGLHSAKSLKKTEL